MLQQFRETDSKDDKEMDDDKDYPDVEIDWDDINKTYEIISQGPDGFDRVTRSDLKSARHAAKAHEEATGQETKINLL